MLRSYFPPRKYVHPIQQFYSFIITKENQMSLSTLPDIFTKRNSQPLIVRKQGGSFSLHLSTQSVQKHSPSRAGYAPGDQNYMNLTANKRRSVSTGLGNRKQSSTREERSKKPDTARDKMTVNLRDEFNFWTGPGLKQKSTISVLNVSNFPYETHRKFNNMTVDLQEGQSIKNRTQFGLKEVGILKKNVEEMQEHTYQIRMEFQHYVRGMLTQIQQFDYNFSQQLNSTYEQLSKCRRETNEGVRENKTDAEKMVHQFQTCTKFTKELAQVSKSLYESCLSVPCQSRQSNEQRVSSPFIDFEGISTIPQSRGATGDQSRQTRVLGMLKKGDRGLSADWDLNDLGKGGNAMTLNGKEIQLFNLEDYE